MKNLFENVPSDVRNQILRGAQPARSASAKARRMKKWCDPMFATLVREQFSDKDWIFEPKLDGIRCLAFREGSKLNLFSRNHIRLNDEFPELVGPLVTQRGSNFINDGEIVALEHGISRFSLLQKRKQRRVSVFYYIFDLLHLDGHDLTHLELRYRKDLLENALSFRDPIRLGEYRKENGEAYYRDACNKGWEGV
jgi:bifunctional non-homologous end joining protein LigD